MCVCVSLCVRACAHETYRSAARHGLRAARAVRRVRREFPRRVEPRREFAAEVGVDEVRRVGHGHQRPRVKELGVQRADVLAKVGLGVGRGKQQHPPRLRELRRLAEVDDRIGHQRPRHVEGALLAERGDQPRLALASGRELAHKNQHVAGDSAAARALGGGGDRRLGRFGFLLLLDALPDPLGVLRAARHLVAKDVGAPPVQLGACARRGAGQAHAQAVALGQTTCEKRVEEQVADLRLERATRLREGPSARADGHAPAVDERPNLVELLGRLDRLRLQPGQQLGRRDGGAPWASGAVARLRGGTGRLLEERGHHRMEVAEAVPRGDRARMVVVVRLRHPRGRAVAAKPSRLSSGGTGVRGKSLRSCSPTSERPVHKKKRRLSATVCLRVLTA